ncbi:AsmA family protein [Glycocaulis profundi]|nr:AsmA family protein [Glycocaulis profundi]
MRRLAAILAILLVILAAAALAIPWLLDAETWRGRIETAASEQLGREVRIAGEMRFTVLPALQIRAGDASVANADGFGAEPLAEIGELRLGLAIGPLLRREIEVTELVLVEPVIRLEQRGAADNWTFAREGEAPPAPASEDGFRRPGALPFEARFGDIRIENGAISYASGADRWAFEALNARLDLPGLDDPARLRGDLRMNGEPLEFDIALGSLRGFMEGARSDLAFTLSGPAISARFEGQAAESADLDLDGRAEIDLPLPRFAALMGAELPQGDTFRRLAASGDLSVRPGRLTLGDARLAFDDIEATGRLAAACGGARPRLTGSLAIPVLDLNPYMPAEAEPRPGGAQDWSRDPIDLSPLRLVDAELDATVERLLVREIEITGVALRAVLDNGRLAADLDRYSLYGGAGRASVVVNARTDPPSYTLNASLDGLQAQPFLTAAADFSRLIGTGTMTLDLAASGNSQAAIMNSLSGGSRFSFADGAITGVNLAQVIRTAQTAIQTRQLPSGFGDAEQTDFTSLGGSLQIADGVARNADLAMLSPLLRVEGAGSVDLPGQAIDYRLTPRAVRSLTGQGGQADLQGVAVPVRIRGGFGDPQVSIDFETLMTELARAQAGRLVGDRLGLPGGQVPTVEDAARGLLEGALGGRQQQPEGEDSEQTRPDPARQLMEGLFGRQRQREEPQEEPGEGG